MIEGRLFIGCDICGSVYSFESSEPPARSCTLCGEALHQRKPNSLHRTWALLCAAAVLFVPANIYPIMTVVRFGNGEPDTILSGVAKLTEADMWPLALLVFVASIVIPVLKIIAIAVLLLSVQRASRKYLREKTVLYRFIEFIGRWSMVDIFMVSILIAIVRLGNLAVIEPGGGAIAFAGVVILTMLASMAFDPRLMWDNLQQQR